MSTPIDETHEPSLELARLEDAPVQLRECPIAHERTEGVFVIPSGSDSDLKLVEPAVWANLE